MEIPEVQGKKQRRRGKQEGWKVGAKKAKKENQEHLDKPALLDMMGNRRSGRRKAVLNGCLPSTLPPKQLRTRYSEF
jgi:hypothetical protein